jgi:hypothetical protein
MQHKAWLLAVVLVAACGLAASASQPPERAVTTVPLSQPLSHYAPAESADKPSASSAPSQAAYRDRDPVFDAILDVITAQRPRFRFHFTPDRLDGDWRLDGVADDGRGPGRLFLDVTTKPGNLTANPCTDPDFVQGGRCTSRILPTGSRLVRRGLVEENGIRTVVVALIHPDRSGLTIEAGNFAIDGFSSVVNRPMPLYSIEDLAELIVAIDVRIGRL